MTARTRTRRRAGHLQPRNSRKEFRLRNEAGDGVAFPRATTTAKMLHTKAKGPFRPC